MPPRTRSMTKNIPSDFTDYKAEVVYYSNIDEDEPLLIWGVGELLLLNTEMLLKMMRSRVNVFQGSRIGTGEERAPSKIGGSSGSHICCVQNESVSSFDGGGVLIKKFYFYLLVRLGFTRSYSKSRKWRQWFVMFFARERS